jgi:hypothetical protein
VIGAKRDRYDIINDVLSIVSNAQPIYRTQRTATSQRCNIISNVQKGERRCNWLATYSNSESTWDIIGREIIM